MKNMQHKNAKYLLRPTTDKVRSAIFNIITANFPDIVVNAKVCDIFAGTGAMGFEALSRGAGKVFFIENDRTTLKYLRENSAGLSDKTEIIPMDANKALNEIKDEKFDIIFLDPPYNKGLIEPTIRKISEDKILKKQGIIVVEHHKKESFLIPDNLKLFKRKEYSDTIISILLYTDWHK
jgi:16S rRNA (guanine966-N2)-methyltransferase